MIAHLLTIWADGAVYLVACHILANVIWGSELMGDDKWSFSTVILALILWPLTMLALIGAWLYHSVPELVRALRALFTS